MSSPHITRLIAAINSPDLNVEQFDNEVAHILKDAPFASWETICNQAMSEDETQLHDLVTVYLYRYQSGGKSN